MDELRAGDMASLIGLSAVRLRDLAASGHAVRTRHGYYDVEGTIAGYVRFWKERAEGSGLDSEDMARELKELELRRERARTLEAELSLYEKQGEVIPVGAVADLWGQHDQAVRQQLLGIPGKLSARFGLDGEVVDFLTEILTDACNELAGTDPFPDLD